MDRPSEKEVERSFETGGQLRAIRAVPKRLRERNGCITSHESSQGRDSYHGDVFEKPFGKCPYSS